jgi:methionine-R-sulfoxide reductase
MRGHQVRAPRPQLQRFLVALPQHPEANRPQGPVLLAVDQEFGEGRAQYDSGTDWPSFFEPIARGAVELHEDVSFSMRRIEVTCARCGGHLGHLFDDGPEPTGERYCMNSISLSLEPDDAEQDGVVD